MPPKENLTLHHSTKLMDLTNLLEEIGATSPVHRLRWRALVATAPIALAA
jgi:hypothetical protein